MAVNFQIQTPNPYESLIGTSTIELLAPNTNTLSDPVTLGTITLNLTNNTCPVFISGVIPVQAEGLTFATGSGNVDLVFNIYNYAQSSTPIFSTQATVVSVAGTGSISSPKLIQNIPFQYLDNSGSYTALDSRTYTFTAQLYSSIAITTGQININSVNSASPPQNSYMNIIAKQIS